MKENLIYFILSQSVEFKNKNFILLLHLLCIGVLFTEVCSQSRKFHVGFS